MVQKIDLDNFQEIDKDIFDKYQEAKEKIAKKKIAIQKAAETRAKNNRKKKIEEAYKILQEAEDAGEL